VFVRDVIFKSSVTYKYNGKCKVLLKTQDEQLIFITHINNYNCRVHNTRTEYSRTKKKSRNGADSFELELFTGTPEHRVGLSFDEEKKTARNN